MDGNDKTVLEHFLDLIKNISLFSELNKIVIRKNSYNKNYRFRQQG